MSNFGSGRRGLGGSGDVDGGGESAGRAPGRRTLTMSLPGRAPTGDSVQQAAAEGISGSAGTLPHLEAIQRSFGRHSVAHVEAHTDTAAQRGAEAMGAEAFATGHHVAFAGMPTLHTVAHEAAHVVQQAGGVQLAGGVGRAGDRYERHADEVADRVVRGESAEALLDEMAGNGAPGAPAVQHKLIPGKQTPPMNLKALVDMLNMMCQGAYVFGQAGDGSLTIGQGDFKVLSDLPPREQTKIDRFGQVLGNVILDPAPVTIDFVGGSKFIIGNFNGQAIDLGDIQTVVGAGRADGDNPVDFHGTLAHEIHEQFLKQTKGQGYDAAHGEASEVEAYVSGWLRLGERTLGEPTQHDDSTFSCVREIVFQRLAPPGDKRTIHMTIHRNKIAALQEVEAKEPVKGPAKAPAKAPVKPAVEAKEDGGQNAALAQFMADLEGDDFDMFALGDKDKGKGKEPEKDPDGDGDGVT